MNPTKPQSRPSATLLRQLGIASATALVVSNIVGTGIFTMTGYLASDLGSAALILWIWVAGAVFALAGAFSYSELGVNFPSSGGEYVYLTEAFGPIWGFMTGWISFFAGFSAPIAAAALAFSDYVGHFNGWFKQENATHIAGSGAWEFHAGGAQVLACSLIVMFTVLNCLGVKRTARVQNALTAAKVFIIIAFIVAGFAFGNGHWSNFSASATRNASTPLFTQFFVSLILLYTAYSGWNAATYVAEEIRQPAKTLPRSLALGTGLVASHLLGTAVAGVFSAAMALSLMATVNAMVTVGPRVYYAMARNGAFFASAAKVAPRWHTPVIAIVCQSICAMLMTFTPFIKLLFYIGMTLNFSAAMSVASLFIFRRRPGWRKLKVVSFLYPLVPAFFIVIGIGTTVFGLIDQTRVCLFSIATVATGALVYRWRLRRKVVDGGP